MYGQRRMPILTPALEGSRPVVPYGYGGGGGQGYGGGGGQGYGGGGGQGYGGGGGQGYGDPGPPGASMRGTALPPIGTYMVPSMMQRPQQQYMGPPQLMPIWGGYSQGGNYYPGDGKFRPHNPMYQPGQEPGSQHQPRQQTQPREQSENVEKRKDQPPKKDTASKQVAPSNVSRHNTQPSRLSHHQPAQDAISNKQQSAAPSRVSRHPPMPSRMSRHPTMQSQHERQPRYQGGPPKQMQQQRQEYHDTPFHNSRKSVKKTLKHPFPGPKALRKFRHIGYVVWFIEKLKANVKTLATRPSSMFLFGIILKEIVAALHRIYLNPSGNIYPVLNDIIGSSCYDLSALVRGGTMSQKEESTLIQELQYVVENLMYHITEIMPSTGVLGTHRKSAVFELLRPGKKFPDGYFWSVEMDRLQFTDHGRTVNISDSEGFLLLLGIFISRSFVTTILMKPIDYGLSSQPLSEVAERNLRITASTLLYLVRRIAVSRTHGPMGMPQEIARYLYQDDEMANVYSKLSRTFNYCEGLLREWGTEYIRRLRACASSHEPNQ